MKASLLTCPEPLCRRAWFALPGALDYLLEHLRRSHAHSETSALDRLAAVGINVEALQ